MGKKQPLELTGAFGGNDRTVHYSQFAPMTVTITTSDRPGACCATGYVTPHEGLVTCKDCLDILQGDE